MARGVVELTPDAATRLAQGLSRRRIEMGYRSARALARESGLDYRTITALEGERTTAVDRNTLTTLEVTLNWPAGTIAHLIEGSEAAETVELTYHSGVAADIIDAATRVAQAAFDAAIEQYTKEPVRHGTR